MVADVARASRQQALRLRSCLAVVVGLPIGCTGSGNEEPAHDVVAQRDADVVTSARKNELTAEPRTTPSAASRMMSIVSRSGAIGDTPDETGKQNESASRPGWKNAEGLYCQAEIDSLESGTVAAGCGPRTEALFEIPDQPGGMHGFSLDDEGTKRERTAIADACCYHVIHPPRGRPLRRADEPGSAAVAQIVERRDWAAHPCAANDAALAALRLDCGERQRAATAWAEDAALEHASVAEFSRIALALLALGAPAALVEAAQRAALDEVDHARFAFGIASALAGRVLGPGSLDLATIHVAPSLVALVRDTIEDGCVGEALAALELAVAADTVPAPAIAETMRTIADDERRHAELGYAIVRWAIDVADDEERAAIAAALVGTVAALKRSLETRDDASSATDAPAVLGRLAATDERRVRRDGLSLAIIPALEALTHSVSAVRCGHA